MTHLYYLFAVIWILSIINLIIRVGKDNIYSIICKIGTTKNILLFVISTFIIWVMNNGVKLIVYNSREFAEFPMIYDLISFPMTLLLMLFLSGLIASCICKFITLIVK